MLYKVDEVVLYIKYLPCFYVLKVNHKKAAGDFIHEIIIIIIIMVLNLSVVTNNKNDNYKYFVVMIIV